LAYFFGGHVERHDLPARDPDSFERHRQPDVQSSPTTGLGHDKRDSAFRLSITPVGGTMAWASVSRGPGAAAAVAAPTEAARPSNRAQAQLLNRSGNFVT
jgi:hypothetical protein